MTWTPSYYDLKAIGSKRRIHPDLRDAIVAEMQKLFDSEFFAAVNDKDALTLKAMAGKSLSAMKVREKTNSNDGYYVELIQYTTYGSRGDAWCMDEDQTCTAIGETITGIVSAFPMTASCADARHRMPQQMIVDKREEAVRGDSFIFLHPSSGMGHVGQLWAWIKKFVSAQLTEGNTTAGKLGDKVVREGGGAYDTERDLDSDPNMVLKMIARAFAAKGQAQIAVPANPVENHANSEFKFKYLMVGDSGAEVEEVQKSLNKFGFPLAVDGKFGPKTKAAVIAFQGQHGLTQDGIVGPVTKGALNSTIVAPSLPASSVVLSWEKGHPERTSWSAFLMDFLNMNKVSFLKAIDLKTFHPDADSFSDEQKLHLLAEVVVATAYFESGWNPKSYSVDVGTQSNRDTWSEGLMQMSVVDQASYKLNLGYNFNDLLDPVKNLDLALRILQMQIEKTSKIVVATNVYWATLRDPATRRSTKVPQIAAKVTEALQ